MGQGNHEAEASPHIHAWGWSPGISERPIIGLTDNWLYRQADNLSVSADRQFCLSAID